MQRSQDLCWKQHGAWVAARHAFQLLVLLLRTPTLAGGGGGAASAVDATS